MRKLFVLVIMTSIAVLFSLSVREASAERVLTDKQITTITNTCQPIQAELDLLHSSDALLRVNIGQRYENIMTSLMSPLNSRLTINQVDTVDVVKTSVDYSDALTEFRKDYIAYEKAVKKAIDMDCQEKPVEFYTTIELARVNRTALQGGVKRLNTLLLSFQKDFRATRVEWRKNNE